MHAHGAAEKFAHRDIAEAGCADQSEDSLDLDGRRGTARSDIDVAVIRLPRIANFDDFEPLAREPRVGVRFVRHPEELDGNDLVVLPGSKSTMADLAWLRRSGLAEAIVAVARAGRPVLGVCGGYQMLGQTCATRSVSIGGEGPKGSACCRS